MNRQHQVNIAELAEKYGRQVFQSAYRILSDIQLAEDVTQEVFIKLFKKTPESFDTVKNWPGYLKNMAVFAAIDQLRRNKRLAEEPLDYSTEHPSTASNQALKTMLSQRDLHQFKVALVSLTAQDAQIFCLRHIEGYAYQEIAELLDISKNLVGVSLHRSQLKLSSQLGESQYLGEDNEF